MRIIRKGLQSHGSLNPCPQSGSLLIGEQAHRLAQNVRLHLREYRILCQPAADTHRTDTPGIAADNREITVNFMADTLQNCPRKLAPGSSQGDMVEGGLRPAVPVRRSPPLKIRQGDDGRPRRFRHLPVDGAVIGRITLRIEGAQKPVKGRTAGEDTALQKIPPGNRRSTAYHMRLHSGRKRINARQQKCSCSRGDFYLPIVKNSKSQRRTLLISPRADYRDAGGKSDRCRQRRKKSSHHASRRHQLTQLHLIHLKNFQKLFIPAAVPQIHKKRTASICIVRIKIPCHKPCEVIRNYRQLIRLLIQLRLILLYPCHLAGRENGVDSGTRFRKNNIIIFFKPLLIYCGALILPHNGRRKGHALFVQRDYGGTLSRQGNRIRRNPFRSAVIRQNLQKNQKPVPPVRRVFLHSPIPQILRPPNDRMLHEHFRSLIIKNSPHTRSAHINHINEHKSLPVFIFCS